MIAALLALAAHGASLASFEQALAAQASATAALGQWCAAQKLATEPTISAKPVRGQDALPPPDLNSTLQSEEEPAYRHVQLSCGGKVLSQAHNWYLRGRMTPEMVQKLDSTDTPFGTAAAPLHFTRERMAALHGPAPSCPKGTILSHRALLRLPSGLPLALVLECYTLANLATNSAQ